MTGPAGNESTLDVPPLRCLVEIGCPDEEQQVTSALRHLGLDVVPTRDTVHVAGWFDVIVVSERIPPHVRGDLVVRLGSADELHSGRERDSVMVGSTSGLIELLSARLGDRSGSRRVAP